MTGPKQRDSTPYRPLPIAQECRPSAEVAVCEWCRFRGPRVKHDYELQDPRNIWSLRWREYDSCEHPAQRHVRRRPSAYTSGRRDDWNRDGACSGYASDFITRILRVFGLRKPILLQRKDRHG